MELNTINKTGTWSETADRINSNFSKISIEVEEIKQNGGGGSGGGGGDVTNADHATSAYTLDKNTPVLDWFLSALNDDEAQGIINYLKGLKIAGNLINRIVKQGDKDVTYTDEDVMSALRVMTEIENSEEKLKEIFLRKNVADSTKFLLSMFAGAVFGKNGFASGLTGFGAKIFDTGHGEFESMFIRRFLEVPELRYNRVMVTLGDKWRAPGAGIIETVDTGTKTCTLKLEDGEIGAVAVGDICMGIYHNITGNATEDYDDGKGNRRFAGFCTVYFTITEVTGERNETFKYQLRPTSSSWSSSFDPFEMMTFVAYGSFTNTERQTSVYETRTYTRMLWKQNTWEISASNVALQYGDLSNLNIFGLNMDGYSMYLNNIYMTGIIKQIKPDGTPVQTLNFREEGYIPGVHYDYYDSLSYNGSMWACINEDGSSAAPGSNGDWLEIASKGDTGAPGAPGKDGVSVTNSGPWYSGLVVPKMSIVTMGGSSFLSKVSTTNPPLWCWTDNAGNRFTFNDGGYCLTGEINTDEYELLVQSGKDGSDGTSYERVFIHTTTESKPATPSTSQTDDYVPSGWHDDPVGVSSSLPYEWVSEREKKNGIWSEFSAPALWAKYGFDGAEGVAGTSIIWKGDFSSAPSNPQNGWAYKNTTDKKSYVYQDGQWYQMTIDGIDGKNGKDGLSIVWKGDLQTPPSNPQTNWAYRDTNNGRVYIWNGTAWALMVVDGSDGADGAAGSDGLSVFITYNDSTSQPSVPTGNGTTGGWHTNATSTAIWMSQKVAASASDGAWGTPIKIKGDKGDGYTQMGQFRTGMVVPKMGVVSMGGGSYVAKASTTNPPLWCWTDNAGNRFTFNDGGYVMTGEQNTAEYDVWAEKGDTGAKGDKGDDGEKGDKGDKGDQGVQGIQGCIIRSSEWKTGVTYRNDESLTSGTRYIDIVAKKNTSPSSLYGWDMYMCKSTHTSSSSNGPGNTTYWTAVNEMAPIFTSLIIAKNASIDLVQGNELIIKDSNNNVVAGLTGGSSKEAGTTPVRIWAGGSVPGSAPFRVDQEGNLVASKANITGTISATGGTIGPFSISSSKLSSRALYESETDKYVGFNLSAQEIEFYNERTGANVKIGGNTKYNLVEGLSLDAGINIQSSNALIGMHIKTLSIPLMVEGGNIYLHPDTTNNTSIHGLVLNARVVTTSLTLNDNDDIISFTNSTDITVKMPNHIYYGKVLFMKKYSGNKVTLTGGTFVNSNSAAEISTLELGRDSMMFIGDARGNWVIYFCG